MTSDPDKCIRCQTAVPDGNKKDLREDGWRFHGRLTYCPNHKQYEFSLVDRDE